MSTRCYFGIILIFMCNILYSQQDCLSNRNYWSGNLLVCDPDCKRIYQTDDNITCINVAITKKDDLSGIAYMDYVRRVVFKDSTIPIYPGGKLGKWPNVLEIHLNNNKIEELENKAFENNKKLLYLYLQDNYISTINQEIFNGLICLRTLNMSNNKIGELRDEVFSNLLNLTELNISYNKLLRLSEHLFNNNQNLETLFLNNNNILNIEENLFSTLEQLKYLYLNNNKLSNISAPIFKYTVNLKGLYLHSNNISNIHIDLFDNLSKLEVLCLENNNLTYIPMGSFGYLHNLEKLNLSYNYLSSLDNAFASLDKLRVLDLANNKIINIHVREFYFLHNIMQINLDNNFLSSLDIQDLITHHHGKHSSIIISLNNNSWKCDWLLNALLLLQKNNFIVSKGPSFKVKNVKGISCLNDNETGPEIVPIRTTNTNEPSVTYEVFTVSNIISSSQTNIALTSELSHTNKESIINSVTEETLPINNVTYASTSTNKFVTSTSEEDFTNSEGLQQHYKDFESEDDKLNELLNNSKEFRFIIIFILIIMLILVLLTGTMMIQFYKEFMKQKYNNMAENNSRSCVLELINHSDQ